MPDEMVKKAFVKVGFVQDFPESSTQGCYR